MNERAVRRKYRDRSLAVGIKAADTFASVSAGPAGSVAAISTAVAPPGSAMREHAHINPRPKPAPKPRSRSSRAWRRDGRVAASRTTWLADSVARSEPQILASIACSRRRTSPRRPRSPTTSATRRRSIAKPAMRSSPAPQVADCATARALTPQSACARNSLPKEFLIMRAVCGVHGAQPLRCRHGAITLIAADRARHVASFELAH